MKICFITDTVFRQGGVARVTTTIANNLSRSNEVTIICTEDKTRPDNDLYKLNKKVNIKYAKLSIQGYKRVVSKLLWISKLEGIRFFDKINLYLRYSYRENESLIQYINNEEFDVVIGVHYNYTLLLGLISRAINCKTIGWQHNSYDAYVGTKKNYLYGKIGAFKVACGNLDKIFVLTEDDKVKYVNNFDITPLVVNNPNSFKPQNNSNLENKIFLAVGRLVKQKGFDILLEAFNIFNKYNKEWSLVIVGEGDEEENLRKKIEKYRIDDYVKIEKFTTNIEKYYCSSTVYLLSSRYEGWGLVWLEAMSCGLPIVAFKLPPCIEAIKGRDAGILVESGNSELFAKAMLEIIEDKKLLVKRSEISKKIANEYTEEEIIKKWIAVLSNLYTEGNRNEQSKNKHNSINV